MKDLKLKIIDDIAILGSKEKRMLVAFTTERGPQEWLCLPRSTTPAKLHESARNRGGSVGPTFSPALKQTIEVALNAAEPAKFSLTDRTGWHDKAFVTSARTYGADKSVHHFNRYQRKRIKQDQRSAKCLSQLTDRYWQRYDLAVFVLACGFAGAILALLDRHSGIHLHLFSEEQNERNFLVRLAMSSDGGDVSPLDPDACPGNAFRVELLSHRDQTVALEELGTSNPLRAETLISDTRVELSRAATDFRPKIVAGETGRLVLLSSGVLPITPAGKSHRHSSARSAQVGLPAAQSGGLFERPASSAKALRGRRELQERTLKAIAEHDGFLMRRYLQKIAADKRRWTRFVRAKRDAFLHARGQARDGAEEFRAEIFAIIAAAGELAIRLGALEMKAGRALDAVLTIYHASEGQRRERAGVTLRSIPAKLQPLIDDGRFPMIPRVAKSIDFTNALGVQQRLDDKHYVLIDKEFEASVFGDDAPAIKAELAKAGVLASKDATTSYYAKQIGGYRKPGRGSFLRIDYGKLLQIVKAMQR